MAWSSVGLWGSTVEKVSDTTLAFSGPARTTPVGNILVLVIACNNVATSDGTSALVSTVTDALGTTWTKAGEYTNSRGSAAAGITTSVWYARVTTQLNVGQTETITFGAANAAKACVCWEFTATNAVITVEQVQQGGSDAEPGPVLTISGLPSQQYLFFNGVGSERGNFGFGVSTNYTDTGSNTTNDPGDATDVAVAGEFRILTASGDSVEPSMGTTVAAVYIALKEAAAGAGTVTAVSITNDSLPVRRRRQLPKGFTGWLNKDNEVAAGLAHIALPEYQNFSWLYRHTSFQLDIVEAPNFEQTQAKATYAIPPGRDRTDRYSGFTAMPLSAPSVESATRVAFDVPLSRNKHSYDGFASPAVGPDINEWLEKHFALPPKGRYKPDYSGWSDNVSNRNETGALVAGRPPQHYDMPPYRRDRNFYDGFWAAPTVPNIEPPVGGFRFFDLNPTGADRRDYSGFQNRSDFTNLTQNPVAGFRFFDMPPAGPNSLMSIIEYTGRSGSPIPADDIPATSKIWRPVFRPRRR